MDNARRRNEGMLPYSRMQLIMCKDSANTPNFKIIRGDVS